MQKLQTLKKMKSKKGFTLMEMLIVVAIIAILVAIAVPVFSNQLEKAKERVDEANVRSATSMAVAEYMLQNRSGEVNYFFNSSTTEAMSIAYSDASATPPTLDVTGTLKGETGTTKTQTIKVVIEDGNVKSAAFG